MIVSDSSSLLVVVAAAMGILGSIASAWAYFKSKAGENLIDLQKETISTLTANLGNKADELKDAQQRYVDAEREVSELKGRVSTLEKVLANPPAFEVLLKSLNNNTRLLLAVAKKMEADIPEGISVGG